MSDPLRAMYLSMAKRMEVFVSRDLLDFLAFQQVSCYDFQQWLRRTRVMRSSQ